VNDGEGQPSPEITFDYLQECALGQLGMSRSEFWEMTPREFQNAMQGFFDREKFKESQAWERCRWETWVLVNVQLPRKSKLKLQDLMKFEWDRKPVVDLPTKEEIERVIAQYNGGSKSKSENMG